MGGGYNWSMGTVDILKKLCEKTCELYTAVTRHSRLICIAFFFAKKKQQQKKTKVLANETKSSVLFFISFYKSNK